MSEPIALGELAPRLEQLERGENQQGPAREPDGSTRPVGTGDTLIVPPVSAGKSPENLDEMRLRCYPPVPLGELRPTRPEPPVSEVAAAMRELPKALSESRFAYLGAHLAAHPSDHSITKPAFLAFAQEAGHGRAAAEWAIYRHAESKRIIVVWPELEQRCPSTDYEERATRFRGGRPATVRDWDYFEDRRILSLRSTPSLWEWYYALNGQNPAGPLRIDEAQEKSDCVSAIGQPTTMESSALPKLLPVHRAELKIIRASEGGIIGKELIVKLNKDGYPITLGTFRRHHVPILKAHGVQNNGRGYYLPSESSPRV